MTAAAYAESEQCVASAAPQRAQISTLLEKRHRTLTQGSDDLATSRLIARVDFIKLDIGSPEKALTGACKTIQTHQPTLALSLPHDEDDLITIQPYLRQFADVYDYFLDHFTIEGAGVVLFARPRGSRPRA